MDGPVVRRWLPMTSAVTITVIGCVITINSLIAAKVFQGRI
jgi:hypothetical protein